MTHIRVISRWFDDGVRQGATHMCIICDTFDYTDFPRYVKQGEDPVVIASKLGEMERLMEVYALHLPKEMQINEYRSFHFEGLPK